MTHLSTAERIAALKLALPTLPDTKVDFAASLIKQFGRYGKLSDKQWFWVDKLSAPAVPAEPKPVVNVGDFAGVIALFGTAKKHLKHPRIRLQLASGEPVVLSVAGPTSKAPGTVNITDGKPFGQNVWYGRVTPAGGWEPSGKADTDTQTSMAALLALLAKAPARVAAEYGKLTGSCCFCNLPLSDKRSTEVGYGKTCASHYGLKWGVQGRSGLLDKAA